MRETIRFRVPTGQPLEELVSQVSASVQPYVVVTALAVLSLITADQDDPAARHGRATCQALGRWPTRPRELVEQATDPGMLPSVVEQAEEAMAL